ncbi:hypothetical protein [Chelativorans sp. AA-79]|uniref:hypothetical protein n=1 Tax=Chelativorans sp. AA-79 TaxID=3028735 RepID=UPI0023FA1111|nr:hypothetical protein [Chelativorans sp. AA-79]WEX11167.1 hypothetical protein PVE73_09650 [Chelativorans sp. AA-79]
MKLTEQQVEKLAKAFYESEPRRVWDDTDEASREASRILVKLMHRKVTDLQHPAVRVTRLR